jgi:hypothetical protein
MALRSRNYVDKSIWNAANGALNGVNVATIGELSTLLPNIVYGSQQDLGKKIAVAIDQIGSYTNTTVGTLYEGVYQVVQVSSTAVAGSIFTGAVAYHLIGTGTSQTQNVVTDVSTATATSLVAGIFLNAVTPGNFTVIFVGGGRVAASFKTTLTNGTPAIGDNVVSGVAGGFVDDAAAGTVAPTGLFIGQAVGSIPASATTSLIFMKNILNRI